MLVAGSQPGLLRPGGFGHLAFVALVPWALFASRPGRRAFLAEWLAATAGLVAMSWWMRHLLPWLVPILGLVPGLYVGLAGVLLRRLARRYPLALACPAAWMAGELLRFILPAPASFGWWRLGTFAHDTEWLAGSARVWGTWGLTWVFAAFAGWVADRIRGEQGLTGHVLGLGPLALGVAATFALPAGETVEGPRVLLVQPGLRQELKGSGIDPISDMYGDSVELTLEGIAGEETPPDLVCWGETMFPFSLVSDEVLEAAGSGLTRLSHVRQLEQGELEQSRVLVDGLVEGMLFGRSERLGESIVRLLLLRLDGAWVRRGVEEGRLLPEGTSFLTGIREWTVHAGAIRSRNSVALWSSDGQLSATAAKTRLVPVAEDSDLYSGFPWVVDLVSRSGGFVPDFVPGEEVGVLELTTREGRRYSFGATVCYDNVYDDPFAVPASDPDLDFHLVASNEGWYGTSVEMDHMVAFSRLAAIATGRSVVRATNSGVSLVLDPSGAAVGEVADPEGRRKMVRGTLAVAVPVPAPGAREATPWARTARWQPLAWAILIGILGVRARSAVTVSGSGGNGVPTGANAASDEA